MPDCLKLRIQLGLGFAYEKGQHKGVLAFVIDQVFRLRSVNLRQRARKVEAITQAFFDSVFFETIVAETVRAAPMNS
jgi:hypothetical protein